jgi:hypothetical protein
MTSAGTSIQRTIATQKNHFPGAALNAPLISNVRNISQIAPVRATQSIGYSLAGKLG